MSEPHLGAEQLVSFVESKDAWDILEVKDIKGLQNYL